MRRSSAIKLIILGAALIVLATTMTLPAAEAHHITLTPEEALWQILAGGGDYIFVPAQDALDLYWESLLAK